MLILLDRGGRLELYQPYYFDEGLDIIGEIVEWLEFKNPSDYVYADPEDVRRRMEVR